MTTPDPDHGAVDALYAAAGEAGKLPVRSEDRSTADDTVLLAFWAAAQPDVVRALIDRLRAVEARNDQLADTAAFALAALNDPDVLGLAAKARLRAVLEPRP